MRASTVALLVLAGCADGKSVVDVHVTAATAVAGVDHLAVTVTEATTPPRSVGPFSVAVSGARRFRFFVDVESFNRSGLHAESCLHALDRGFEFWSWSLALQLSTVQFTE